MVRIAIITGVYKPTYNWGAPPCGIRPCWGLPDPSKGEVDLPEDGILGEAWLSSTAETHGSIMDLRSIKTLLCFYLYLQEIHKKYEKRSKTIKHYQKEIKNYQTLSKTHFSKPDGQVVNFAPFRIGLGCNRPFPSCVLITRPSGGGEVGKERKALEQLPKVLQTQWGTVMS